MSAARQKWGQNPDYEQGCWNPDLNDRHDWTQTLAWLRALHRQDEPEKRPRLMLVPDGGTSA